LLKVSSLLTTRQSSLILWTESKTKVWLGKLVIANGQVQKRIQSKVNSWITIGGITATENVFVYVRHRRLVTFVFEHLINIRLLLLLLLQPSQQCQLQ